MTGARTTVAAASVYQARSAKTIMVRMQKEQSATAAPLSRMLGRTLKFNGTMLSTRITNNIHDFSSSNGAVSNIRQHYDSRYDPWEFTHRYRS